MYKSLFGYTSFLTPRRKIIGSYSKSISKFLRNVKTFQKLLYNFTLPPATYESFHCSTSSPTLTVVSYFNFIHSSGCAIVSHMDLICISLISDDVKHLFRLCVFIYKVSFSSFCSFLVRLFVLLLSYKSSLYILDTSLLSDIHSANIFSNFSFSQW